MVEDQKDIDDTIKTLLEFVATYFAKKLDI